MLSSHTILPYHSLYHIEKRKTERKGSVEGSSESPLSLAFAKRYVTALHDKKGDEVGLYMCKT